jgi:hypothetical protein
MPREPESDAQEASFGYFSIKTHTDDYFPLALASLNLFLSLSHWRWSLNFTHASSLITQASAISVVEIWKGRTV